MLGMQIFMKSITRTACQGFSMRWKRLGGGLRIALLFAIPLWAVTNHSPSAIAQLSLEAQQASEIEAIWIRLKLARRQAASIGPKHPSFEQFQRQLAELEEQYARLSRPESDRHGGASAPPNDSAEAESAPSIRVRERSNPERIDTFRRQKGSLKPMILADSLELVGGWILPRSGAGGKGLGYSRGGLLVEHGVGRERILYTYGHQQVAECHVLKVTLDYIGNDSSQRKNWPVATPMRLLENTHRIKRNSPYNLCRPQAGGPLLTTGRVFYATQKDDFLGPWMNWYDESDGSTSSVGAENRVNRRQVFGGGFCDIPAWFADQHLDGRDFGVGFGGYRSGQNSSTGPSFFASKRPQKGDESLNDCVDLLSFPWNGRREQRERRPPDYTKPLWGPPVEDGVGWWQADMIVAGPVWIDTPGLTGLCYWSLQGLGDLEYKLQTATFSKERRVRLYVYDPAELADVVEGRLKPHQVRGTIFEWPLPFDESPNAKRWPIGAFWDSTDQLLYLAYQESGVGNYGVPPAVAIYRVK